MKLMVVMLNVILALFTAYAASKVFSGGGVFDSIHPHRGTIRG